MNEKRISLALGSIPSGLFIVTVRNGEHRGAFLASWIQQTSFHPPMITMAMAKDRPIGHWFSQGRLFGVHILSDHHKKLLKHFAKPPVDPEEVFEGLRHHPSLMGVPVLTESLNMIECRVVKTIGTGDHDLVIGEVVDAHEFEKGKPRVHIRKNGFQY
jgi:flavin reductase (DIM6/NTAB) family NADH-FMN oxidoreductase RutF